MNLKRDILNNALNIPGWRTNRRIVVIESDDWGSIRMPSKTTYNDLLQHGIRVDKCHYLKYDHVERKEDIAFLCDVLDSVKDKTGHSAVITMNTLVANPDFQKIKEADFTKYFYKNIQSAYAEINGSEDVFDLIRNAQTNEFLSVQSHGREHLNVKRWLNGLQQNLPQTRYAFERGVYGVSTTVSTENRKTYLAAFDADMEPDENDLAQIAADALNLFENTFGFKSKSFIAPNYVWGKGLEKVLSENGVRYIQGLRLHRYVNSKSNHVNLRYVGRKNQYQQVSLVRNVFFEPSEKSKDWVDQCLKDIANAFLWKHPAVICSHRVNFMGGLVEKNRDDNLQTLAVLLKKIVTLWPDVEFMSSDKLGDLINGDI